MELAAAGLGYVIFGLVIIFISPFVLYRSCKKAGFTENNASTHFVFWLCIFFGSIFIGNPVDLLLPAKSAENINDEVNFFLENRRILNTALSFIFYFAVQALLLFSLFHQNIKICIKALIRFYLIIFFISLPVFIIAIIIGFATFIQMAS